MYSKEKLTEIYAVTKDFLKRDLTTKDYNSLIEVLHYHEWKYYVDNNPVISDFEYDQLFQKLKFIEDESPQLLRADSPSQRVSSDLSTDFPPVKHLNPMLSLANSYNEEDLKEFDKQIRKLSQKEERDVLDYFVEPKLDGGSVALVYKNDLLVRAATRGNGSEGEEITLNAKALSSVPLSAKFSDHNIHIAELRGEAVMAKDIFVKKNIERESNDLQVFANARNAATGGLRMKDPGESRRRGLEVFIFQLAYAVDSEGNDVLPGLINHSNSIAILSSLGFKIPSKGKQLFGNINEALLACQQWEKEREDYNYEIDGAVVKLDSFELQDKCGSTRHHPRWAIAYKFKAKQATTTLMDVEFQIGKTGALTPVAKVEPVHLAGVTVSSISLHNEDFIIQKDLRLGDKVIIERAGDVIPYIVKPLEELRTGDEKKISFPKNCPFCTTELEKTEEQAAWRCPNYSCAAQNLQRIIYHVSKDAMNIDGFGKSYVEKFIEMGWIKDISDIYNLDYSRIANLEGFGEKSAENLSKAIEKAKGNPLNKLLNSLSIHHLGRKASILIAQHINNIFELIDWNEENFTEIKDIGPVVAENVMAYFRIPENIDMIKRLRSYGVNVTQIDADRPVAVSENAPMLGKTILFTGSLQEMTRKEAQSKAEKAGAKNISAVSSNLDILVAGEKAGSKLKKAEAIGSVQILTEKEFLDILNS